MLYFHSFDRLQIKFWVLQFAMPNYSARALPPRWGALLLLLFAAAALPPQGHAWASSTCDKATATLMQCKTEMLANACCDSACCGAREARLLL
jgi:hypothetical protein